MSFSVEILSAAEEDIDNAFIWYEIKQIGLGDSFFNSLNNSVALIAVNPFSHRQIYKNVRRVVIKKFPFGLYYKVNQSSKTVQIIGVIHFRRSTKIFRRRI